MFEKHVERLMLNGCPFPLHEDMRKLDSTKINTFLDCPRQYFFNYVLGWISDRPNNHLVFGSAWHEAMEFLLLNDYSELSIVQAYDKFETYYRSHFPADTDELFKPKTPNNALKALMAYCDHYRNDHQQFRALYTEIAGSIAIDKERSIIFRMDSVCEDLETGALFSLEHKTKGSSFTRQWVDQWALSFQVGTYSHVLNCFAVDRPVKGVTINGVAFAQRETKFQRVPVYRSPAHMQNWLFHARYYCERIEEEYSQLTVDVTRLDAPIMMAFPMNPQACTKYFGCPYYDYCCAWTNPLQHAEEPPLGFKMEHWDPLAQPAKLEVKL